MISKSCSRRQRHRPRPPLHCAHVRRELYFCPRASPRPHSRRECAREGREGPPGAMSEEDLDAAAAPPRGKGGGRG
eukprot:6273096-Pyramimonas_sp.AAC.1